MTTSRLPETATSLCTNSSMASFMPAASSTPSMRMTSARIWCACTSIRRSAPSKFLSMYHNSHVRVLSRWEMITDSSPCSRTRRTMRCTYTTSGTSRIPPCSHGFGLFSLKTLPLHLSQSAAPSRFASL